MTALTRVRRADARFPHSTLCEESKRWEKFQIGIAACALILTATGCSWTDAAGTHRLIVGIGFGVITSTNRAGVEVRDSRVLGAEFGPEAFGVGWASRHRVVIDPRLASNVVVSVKANPFNLTVEHYDLNSTNSFDTLKKKRKRQ